MKKVFGKINPLSIVLALVGLVAAAEPIISDVRDAAKEKEKEEDEEETEE